VSDTVGGAVNVRIGVCGHRSLHDPAQIAAMVDLLLDRLLDAGTKSATVVSALAEGADRLVVERVLQRPGARLEALLPLPATDFETDFGTDDSLAEFRALLQRAGAIEVVSADPTTGDRLAAYERAGFSMVDRVDVVIALWDGEPSRGRGGTADVIQYALDHDVLVEVLLIERGDTP